MVTENSFSAEWTTEDDSSTIDPSKIDDDDLFPYIPFINDIWVVAPPSEIIIKTSVFLPTVVFGIFGNILILHTLITNKHIQTPTNMLIGNMALADLCSVLIYPWVFLSYDLFQNYQLGDFGCKTEAAFECTLMIASVVSLSAISYDRLTAIVLPKETRLNKKGTKILIIIGWIVAVLLSAPLSLIRNYKERQWKNFCEMSCTEKIVIANVYWYVVIAVLVWLPLTIQLICYIAIFVELTKYEKVVLRKLNLHQVSYKKKAVRMMFIVVITFMICRLPFTALIIYRHRLIEKNDIEPSHVVVQIQIDGFYYALWFISKYLIYVNAALNPLIYGVTNEKFRRGFKTTKLANWLFSPQRFTPVVIKTKDKEKKTSETVLRLNNNIFFIFRKQNKHKHIESSATPLSSGLFSPLDKCKF